MNKNMRRLNILLLSYMHGEGGIQTHSRYLAKGLTARGHTVRILSPQPMPHHSPASAALGSIQIDTYGNFTQAIRTARREPPDVAIVTGTGWKAMGAAMLLPRHCRKVFFEVMSGSRSQWLDPRMLVHSGADAVVGQARPVMARFRSAFRWHGRWAVIPALPEPLELAHDIPPRPARALGKSAPVRFAFFSRLAPHKNAKLLISSWESYAPPGSTLDIWGAGPEADNLQKMIITRGLDREIALRGRYPEGAAYIRLLQSYDLLLLPTIGDEGAPLVLLEAMACGLPFVANGVGGIPDYANQDCAITSGNISEFEPAIRDMVHRLQNGNINPVRLQQYYEESFSFHRLIDRWEAFLSDVTISPRARSLFPHRAAADTREQNRPQTGHSSRR